MNLQNIEQRKKLNMVKNKILCKWGKHELPSYVVSNSNILKLLPCKICGWDIYTNKQVKQ